MINNVYKPSDKLNIIYNISINFFAIYGVYSFSKNIIFNYKMLLSTKKNSCICIN